jgi:hypothetical protein
MSTTATLDRSIHPEDKAAVPDGWSDDPSEWDKPWSLPSRLDKHAQEVRVVETDDELAEVSPEEYHDTELIDPTHVREAAPHWGHGDIWTLIDGWARNVASAPVPYSAVDFEKTTAVYHRGNDLYGVYFVLDETAPNRTQATDPFEKHHLDTQKK